ncbi:membrane protein [Mycolicibacterium agri]|uniref:Membrane protein n=1 Tax=Mycolicibacterium agri TaxID=36811 RepID=A0A7I9W5R6_MYCAG|nr:membrane protein [Mycolicibacterium agri]
MSADTALTDPAMETFELRMPGGVLGRLFDRNGLIRRTDRIEAAVLALVMIISLVALPFAAAFGTAVYDSRRDALLSEAQSRHVVTATITEGQPDKRPPARIGAEPTDTKPVEARWFVDGMERTATVSAPETAKPGDPIDIWVNDAGEVVGPPPASVQAAVDGVTTAVVLWAGVCAAGAVVFALTRMVCDRIRSAAWEHDIDRLSQAL